MHPSDQHPSASGRPSATSPDHDNDLNRPRIVGGLDCIDSDEPPSASGNKFPWVLGAILLLAMSAGAVMWSGADGEKQIVMAGTEPVLAEPAVVPQVEQHEAAMSEAPPPPAVRPATTPPIAEAPELVRTTPAKAVAPKKPKPSALKKKAAPAVRPERMSPADKDVALLAAVVTHTKAMQHPPSVLTVKWRQCAGAKSVAAAKACRSRLCAANPSASECAKSR